MPHSIRWTCVPKPLYKWPGRLSTQIYWTHMQKYFLFLISAYGWVKWLCISYLGGMLHIYNRWHLEFDRLHVIVDRFDCEAMNTGSRWETDGAKPKTGGSSVGGGWVRCPQSVCLVCFGVFFMYSIIKTSAFLFQCTDEGRVFGGRLHSIASSFSALNIRMKPRIPTHFRSQRPIRPVHHW